MGGITTPAQYALAPANVAAALAGQSVPGALTVTGALTTQAGIANSGGTIASSSNIQSTGVTTIIAGGGFNAGVGAVDVPQVGQGLKVAEGANAKQGTAVLAAGTVTVANTSVTASSRIVLTSNLDGGTPGFVRVSARVAGTSFTITSSSGTDTSTIAYEIFEPG